MSNFESFMPISYKKGLEQISLSGLFPKEYSSEKCISWTFYGPLYHDFSRQNFHCERCCYTVPKKKRLESVCHFWENSLLK